MPGSKAESRGFANAKQGDSTLLPSAFRQNDGRFGLFRYALIFEHAMQLGLQPVEIQGNQPCQGFVVNEKGHIAQSEQDKRQADAENLKIHRQPEYKNRRHVGRNHRRIEKQEFDRPFDYPAFPAFDPGLEYRIIAEKGDKQQRRFLICRQ